MRKISTLYIEQNRKIAKSFTYRANGISANTRALANKTKNNGILAVIVETQVELKVLSLISETKKEKTNKQRYNCLNRQKKMLLFQ